MPCSKRLTLTSTTPASGSPLRTTVAGMNARSHSRTCAETHRPVVRPITMTNDLLGARHYSGAHAHEKMRHWSGALPAMKRRGVSSSLQRVVEAVEDGAGAAPAEADTADRQAAQGRGFAVGQCRRSDQDRAHAGAAARCVEHQGADRPGELVSAPVGHQGEARLRTLSAQREEIDHAAVEAALGKFLVQ